MIKNVRFYLKIKILFFGTDVSGAPLGDGGWGEDRRTHSCWATDFLKGDNSVNVESLDYF